MSAAAEEINPFMEKGKTGMAKAGEDELQKLRMGTKGIPPMTLNFTSNRWVEEQVKERRHGRREEALEKALPRQKVAIKGKQLPKTQRRVAAFVLALRSGYGDLEDYHDRFDHD